ncbi:contact-dependent growth inhibition system immunity protein [Streptomyces sp. NPDC002133]|uniref:contact-dependent growth inhibition system immunity protein n=1 Tax=Streptomyces sp. NPDC002133 TaxID=3154409 RepID=UPI00331AD2B2
MPRPVPPSRTLEELEDNRRPPPAPGGSTGLVLAVHALRKRPVGSLTVDELVRLIGQDLGLLFLMPVALKILRDTLPAQHAGGWYDDDLLTVALTRSPAAWTADPECSRELLALVGDLRRPLPSYVRRGIEHFLASLPPEVSAR